MSSYPIVYLHEGDPYTIENTHQISIMRSNLHNWWPYILLLLRVQAVNCWTFFPHSSQGSYKTPQSLVLSNRRSHDRFTFRSFQATAKSSFESISFSVPSTQLDSNLSADEKTTVNIFRKYGPSVAFVTSVAFMTSESPSSSTSRISSTKYDNLPRGGMGLGSGSAFIITEDGYLLTNYHVIERAYRIIHNRQRVLDSFSYLVHNITEFLNTSWFTEFMNTTQSLFLSTIPFSRVNAKVYIRINSSTKFNECRIVDVVPELDMAVLKIRIMDEENQDKTLFNNTTMTTSLSLTPIPLGSSSDLLVGQNLIAIGNPFGLDRTVTTGVVSALDRSVTGVAGNQIRGCIQTDAAINPGNSGGPSLDSQGRVVGINTMILSTSGSNAGIGFAIPIDAVREKSDVIIDKDRLTISSSMKRRPSRGWLGIEIVVDNAVDKVLRQKLQCTIKDSGILVLQVKPDSPAQQAGILGLTFSSGNMGVVDIGDRIIAVAGRTIENRRDLENDLKSRVEGEKLSITLENAQGDRRVVYIMLQRKPL